MKERRHQQPDVPPEKSQFDWETRVFIAQVTNGEGYLRQLLDDHDSRVVITPQPENTAHIPIDLGFFEKSRGPLQMSPVELIEGYTCIGFRIITDDQTPEGLVNYEVRPDMKGFENICDLENVTKVTVVQASKERIVEVIDRAYRRFHPEESSLEVESNNENSERDWRIDMIMEMFQARSHELVRLGIDIDTITTSLDRGKLGLVFEQKSRTEHNGSDFALLPMLNVLNYDLSGVAGVSLYDDDFKPERLSQADVFGIYFPDEDETVAEAAITARRIRSAYMGKGKLDFSATYGSDIQPRIAVATTEQMELWREKGIVGKLEAYRPDSASLEKALTFLEPQIVGMAHIRIHAVNNREVDVMFESTNPEYPGEAAMFDVMGILEGKPDWVKNTVGFFCCEADLSDSQRKGVAKILRGSHRMHLRNFDYKNNRINILSVNDDLLKLWQETLDRGEPIVRLAEIGDAQDSEFDEAHEQAFIPEKSRVENVYFYMYEPGASGIGARYMELQVEQSNGHTETVVLDMGLQFDEFAWQGIETPSFELGVLPFEGVIPKIPRLFRRSLLLKTAEHGGEPFFAQGADNFWVSDLYHQLGSADFTRMVKHFAPDVNTRKLIAEIEKQDDFKTIHQVGVLFSHMHMDHVGFGGALATRIPQLYSDESWPMAQSLYLFKNGYLQEVSIRSQRETFLTKKSQRTFTPPLHMMEPYEKVVLGNGHIEVTCLPVDHSIYGSAMFKVQVNNELGEKLVSLGYTGDYRFNDSGLTEAAIKEMLDVDVLVTDTTNLEPGFEHKPSLKVNREIMQEAFNERIRNTEGLAVFQLGWNNLRDLYEIMEASKLNGREMFMYPKPAVPLHLYSDLDEIRRYSGQGFPWSKHNPRVRLGVDAGIYQTPKATQRSMERFLYNRYRKHVVTPSDAGKNEGDLVIVLPPLPFLEQTMGHLHLSHPASVTRSHYWPYGMHDKAVVKKDMAFCEREGIDYDADLEVAGRGFKPPKQPKYHMSGHAHGQDIVDFVKFLYEEGDLQTVIPVHGRARRYVGNLLEDEIGTTGEKSPLVVIKRVDKGGWKFPIY